MIESTHVLYDYAVALLRALDSLSAPAETDTLLEMLKAKSYLPFEINHNGAQDLLSRMAVDGLVAMPMLTLGRPARWSITDAGREYLRAHGYPLLKTGAAPSAAVSESVTPAIDYSSTATLCVTEAELTAWWDGLDVECKADAFMGFSIRPQGVAGNSWIDVSHEVHLGNARIPITGTVKDESVSYMQNEAVQS